MSVLQEAQQAVSAAAASDRAVSGAGVVAVARRHHQIVSPVPTFSAGEGGTVRYLTSVSVNGEQRLLDACVRFPAQAFGIPVVVECPPRLSRGGAPGL